MRVAINTVGVRGGEAHFLRKSLEALAALRPGPDLVILAAGGRPAGFGGFEMIEIAGSAQAPGAAKKAGADLLFSAIEGLAPDSGFPLALYMLQLYDLRKQSQAKGLFGASPLRAAKNVAAQARAVVVPSEFMRREALEVLGVTLEKIVVAPLGVDEAFAQPHATIVEKPYFLYVGRISERKNLPVLLEAFRRLQDEMPHSLLIVGEPGEAEPASWGPRIVRIDHVGTAQLAGLYQHADVVLSASTYEGSGVLALEALKAGARVAVGRIGGIPEVAGDAPMYIVPDNVDSVTGMMRRCAQEGPQDRERRAKLGHQMSTGWAWEKTARQLMTAFRKATA
jgi:glycosyltransferase involved in cell wall biosynthesis